VNAKAISPEDAPKSYTHFEGISTRHRCQSGATRTIYWQRRPDCPRSGVQPIMMTTEKAQRIIEAGIVKAKEIGQPMNIAVVDAGANLAAFVRMDGAWLGSIDIAINKAFTAKAFDISTLELGRNSQPGDQFFGIHVSNHARVMIFAGGIPIKMNGTMVGAVGVSGGSGKQDQAVAEAAVAAWS
jgi:uncharacterized protein GlcG (DUF336 family)